MQNEIFIAFMAGWSATAVFTVVGSWIGWLYLDWTKTKIRKLELEKIITVSKCKFKEMEIQAQNQIQKIKQIEQAIKQNKKEEEKEC